MQYRNIPAFYPGKRDLIGKCRNGREYDCEDCTITDISLVKNVHYTNCRKPWNCAGEELHKNQPKTALGIDTRTTNITTCYKVMTKWHKIRTHFEDAIHSYSSDNDDEDKRKIQAAYKRWRDGDYKMDIFQGHCKEHGQNGYNPIILEEEKNDVLGLLAIALKKIYR